MKRTRIRVGDEVQVMRGNAEDRVRGRVLKIMHTKGQAIIEGVRTMFKHVRPDPSKGSRGGRIEKSMPVNVSNLAIVDPKTGQIARIAIKEVDGKRVRINKKTGEEV